MAREKVKLLRLKRRGGQKRTKHASLSCYAYQKDEIIKRARQKKMTVSAYLNWLINHDWIH